MKTWSDFLKQEVVVKDGSEADGEVGYLDYVENGVGIVILQDDVNYPRLKSWACSKPR